MDAPEIFVKSRTNTICSVPVMTTGNRAVDGGNLIIENEDYEEFIKKEPKAKPYIKKLVGAVEFINNKKRWCLWLVGVGPSELRNMPLVMERVAACKEDRENAPDAVLFIPDTSIYHFGILTSNIHMAWMRAVCGRLKSDYRYSTDIVYNNFPWPEPTEAQKAKIEQTAQGILDARALYPDSSLGNLWI